MAHYTATVKKDRSLELPLAVRKLLQPGQHIEIDLPDPPKSGAPEPNYAMLKTLEEIAKRQDGRRFTDGSQTDAIIREGRAGAMYGYEPNE